MRPLSQSSTMAARADLRRSAGGPPAIHAGRAAYDPRGHALTSLASGAPARNVARSTIVRLEVGRAFSGGDTMPGVTAEDILVLPRVPDPDPAIAVSRPVVSVTTAPSG